MEVILIFRSGDNQHLVQPDSEHCVLFCFLTIIESREVTELYKEETKREFDNLELKKYFLVYFLIIRVKN